MCGGLRAPATDRLQGSGADDRPPGSSGVLTTSSPSRCCLHPFEPTGELVVQLFNSYFEFLGRDALRVLYVIEVGWFDVGIFRNDNDF